MSRWSVPTEKQRSARRTDPLSQKRLVRAAVEILDADGEDALTFRALAGRLETGPGAIYHHVANKSELLEVAASGIIRAALERAPSPGEPPAEPLTAIRKLALGVFDAIDAHPWVGTQLTRKPWQFAVIQLFEAVGAGLDALGVPREAQFDSASTLVNYILGLAGQYAAASRLLAPSTDRRAFLGAIADEWTQLDPSEFPFMHGVAEGLEEHSDRDQFLFGIDLILGGIQAAR